MFHANNYEDENVSNYMIFENIKEQGWKKFTFIYIILFFYEMVNIFWW